MKHLLKFTLFLLALLLPASATAYNFEVDGIYYNKNGTNATVTYRTTSYNSYSGDVIIPSTVTYNGTTYSVTSIGYDAFKDCNSLTSIAIPNSVTSIGNYAFYGCCGLTCVFICNSVTSIGYSAFGRCSGLTSIIVESGNIAYDSRDNCNAIIETATNTLITGCMNTTIPNSVTSIGSYAFYHCSGLTSVTIPNSVTSIGSYAFNDCSSLTSIAIPNSVTSIGYSAFKSCTGLTSLTIGNSVTSIGDYAFLGCSALDTLYFNAISCSDFTSATCQFDNLNISNIIIGDSVQRIPAYFAFGFTNLTCIKIPNSVTIIGNYAFNNCIGLTSVEIPSSVTEIDWAFLGCSGLTSINVDSGNSTYDSRDNCNAIIETATNTLINGCMNTTIPNSVISIGMNAFRDLSGLMSVTIPNSVTSIGNYAFYGCSGLSNVAIPNSVTSIGSCAFYGCSGLTSVTIPKSVTSIGSFAFYGCSGLTSVTIPNSVTFIGSFAFSDCSCLNDVYSFITDPWPMLMGTDVFNCYSQNYAIPTLHVPTGSTHDYQVENEWSDFFGSIVEMGPMVATSIELNKSAAMMEYGEELQLTAELQPIEAIYNEVLWGTSNPSVATVSSDGLVMALAQGTATITAMTTDGSNLSASCIVTVTTMFMKGDVDGNGLVNISDVTSLIDYLLNGDASAIDITNADCDGSRVVNISDVTELIDYLLSGHWPEPEPSTGITSYTVNGVTFNMVEVEGGTFSMGGTPEQGDEVWDREKPVHQVTLSTYHIGQTEVTQELWQAVMGENPSHHTGDLLRPVEMVSWVDCQEFIAQLNQLTGKSFRLPTEAEWEYAARGGKLSQGYRYAGGNDMDDVSWYLDNSDNTTHPVATKAPNELGLYDMTGNVWEWCNDWYKRYTEEPQTNPTGPETGNYRVLRGGCWNGGANYNRISFRDNFTPTGNNSSGGLRLVLDTEEPEMPFDDEEFVDLGLPSGTLWATKNIGALRPEDFGDYFSAFIYWDYYEINHSHATCSAKEMMRSSVYLPTLEEIEELAYQCTWTRMMKNNVNGFLVTGPNGNSIFLPAAGEIGIDYDSPNGLRLYGVGGECCLWSQTITYHSMYDEFYLAALYAGYSNNNSEGVVEIGGTISYNMFSVRRVMHNSQNQLKTEPCSEQNCY